MNTEQEPKPAMQIPQTKQKQTDQQPNCDKGFEASMKYDFSLS